MLDKLQPDHYFDSFTDITPEFLLGENIKALMIDIDNTLAPYDMPAPDERILSWLSALEENGIGFAFISNNSSSKRIEIFNEKIGAPAFHNSKKPLAQKNIDIAMCALGAKKESTAFLGDQIFTDVCAGKIYGIRTILVPPIRDKKNLFFRFKRALERPIMKSYFKRNIR